MLILNNVLFLCNLAYVVAYGNQLHNLLSLYTEQNNTDCVDSIIPLPLNKEKLSHETGRITTAFTYRTIGTTTGVEEDPVKQFRNIINQVLFGNNSDGITEKATSQLPEDVDLLAHFPLGKIMRWRVVSISISVGVPTGPGRASSVDLCFDSSPITYDTSSVEIKYQRPMDLMNKDRNGHVFIDQNLQNTFESKAYRKRDKYTKKRDSFNNMIQQISRFRDALEIRCEENDMSINRGELFYNKSAVHLPVPEFMYRGHCYLKLTLDHMQTAVDAFGILVQGNIDDVLRLPSHYVLKSARAISMMKLSREKLAAMWPVVRGDLKPWEVPYETLEIFRPLFKYLTGREMAKLNLTDSRVLMYIGTHADLSRHQVGVVASHYIRINSNWREPKYLNLMNNLLCGIPIPLLRNLPETTLLQISNQLFFHIRACDPLQRRFYLAKMSRTQILGKANSWSARDVHRLGLLITEVDGPELATINPEAFAGITAQLMVEMSTQNLKYITKRQIQYLSPKPYNILAKKMKAYSEVLRVLNSAKQLASISSYVLIIYKVLLLHWCK